MNKPIEVAGGSSVGENIPVRRQRNTQGKQTVTVAVSLPKELNQTINGIVVKDNKSRSRVISELLKKGLERNE